MHFESVSFNYVRKQRKNQRKNLWQWRDEGDSRADEICVQTDVNRQGIVEHGFQLR